MARRPRRNHSAQFKAKVALEAIASDKTLAEIAQKYDVHANQIVDWKEQLVDVDLILGSKVKKISYLITDMCSMKLVII